MEAWRDLVARLQGVHIVWIVFFIFCSIAAVAQSCSVILGPLTHGK